MLFIDLWAQWTLLFHIISSDRMTPRARKQQIKELILGGLPIFTRTRVRF